MISVDSHLTFSLCHPFCPPGRLMFLSSWIHVKDTCTEVSSPSKLYSHKLVPLLASACSAVRQLYFHRENTWTGGASCYNLKLLLKVLTLMLIMQVFQIIDT